MLVLNRKNGEVLVIGQDITVTVIKAKDGSCRLGIVAPPHITVDRLEIAELRSRERQLQETSN